MKFHFHLLCGTAIICSAFVWAVSTPNISSACWRAEFINKLLLTVPAIWFSLLLIPIFVYLFWRDEPFARACLRSCHEDFPIVQIFALVTVMHDSIETHILFLPWKILPGISHPLRPYGLPSALMETFLSVAVSCEGRRRSFPKLRLSRKKKKHPSWCGASRLWRNQGMFVKVLLLASCVCVCVLDSTQHQSAFLAFFDSFDEQLPQISLMSDRTADVKKLRFSHFSHGTLKLPSPSSQCSSAWCWSNARRSYRSRLCKRPLRSLVYMCETIETEWPLFLVQEKCPAS